MTTDDPLRLVALDAEDLAVLAAHVQDAVVKLSDIVWRPREKRVVLALNRFVWEAASAGRRRSRTWQRRRAALRFERVEAMRSSGIDRQRPDDVLSLLTIRFELREPPGGCVELVFAGGAAMRLDVECLEAELTDLGAAWSTPSKPQHGFG